MPIRAFWLMSGNIRRVRAGNDLRAMMVATVAQAPEGAKEMQERLVLEMGDVYVSKTVSPLEVERDEEGFNELKAMAAVM